MLVCIFGILVLGIRSLMNGQVRQMYAQLDGVDVTALSEAADGTYEGNAETPLVKVRVEVTVENHALKEIRLLCHENGKGAPAEAMLPEMIFQNTSEVNGVSGATMSSKAIRAAVRDALAKAASQNTVIHPLSDPLEGAWDGSFPGVHCRQRAVRQQFLCPNPKRRAGLAEHRVGAIDSSRPPRFESTRLHSLRIYFAAEGNLSWKKIVDYLTTDSYNRREIDQG